VKTEQHLLALPEGYRLGKYLLHGVLGSGGFGITYLAEDTSLGRRVAIKELLPGDFATRVGEATVAPKGREGDRENLEWAQARFLEEGRVLAACAHSNVVGVYEAIVANGTAYLVTRYEEGQDLERWLRGLGRAPTEVELRGILWPLLSGLEQMHQTGFLHRDIKPENIYLTTKGIPVLLDFGSARQAIGTRSRMLTAVVTPGYAPFEQYHEGGHQGPWTDIYALGAVMHRAITGQKPPEAAGRMMGNDPYKSLAATQGSQYSAAFLKGLDRALRVKVSERPQSIAEWRALLGEGAVAAPAKLAWLKPRWWWWCLGGAAALVGLTLWLASPHPQSPPGGNPVPGSTASAHAGSTATGRPETNLPTTLLVPGNYATIQAAINAARPGDTVRLKAGTYTEALKFKTGITLEGDDVKTTIVRYWSPPTGIAGQGDYEMPLEARNCSSGTVRNITFREEQTDPRPKGDNTFKMDAVMIVDSTVNIEGCHATSLASCGIGVYGSKSSPGLLNNQCSGSPMEGILFDYGARGTAQGNVCEDNGENGIAAFEAGTNPTIKGNRCRANTLNGIYFGNGAGGSAEDNVCEKNANSGLMASGAATNAKLKGNQCRSNTLDGIYFGYGAQGSAEGNVCEENVWCGIAVFNSGTNPELKENKCQLNNSDGIYFGIGAQGRATQNVCSSNLIGIAIHAASPELDGNVLRSNKQYGLACDESAKPVFVGAQIYDGNKEGETYLHMKFQ
jgi:parallel beta-helix repeat protein